MLQFWLGEDEQNKVVSAIAQIEARSAICRLRREGRMGSGEASIASNSIIAELKRIVEQPVNPQVLYAASALVDRHNLRTLDAIQLGSAIVARDLLASREMRFIASDQALLVAAKAEGFATWNPAASARDTIGGVAQHLHRPGASALFAFRGSASFSQSPCRKERRKPLALVSR